MTTRTKAPVGAPCWADLWTSDVPGARRFYAELLGWHAEEPSPEFGGYFIFTRDGVETAGCMGDMGEMRANNTWKVYLATEDMSRTLEAAMAGGAEILVPASPVADLGIQAVLNDPTGANLGAWEARNFPGFTVLSEPSAPTWFELHTRDYQKAVEFYRTVFGWNTEAMGDTEDFRYTVMKDPRGDGELAGIMDSSAFLPAHQPAHWAIYFDVDDIDAAVAKVEQLGGSVVMPPENTPYGRLAVVNDHAGAEFRLRTPLNE